MSGQRDKTPEKVSYDTGQQTPVIIKTGGNGTVTIDAQYNPFNELVPGPTWVVSQSVSRRKISELRIGDCEGTKMDRYPRTSSELATIRIEYQASPAETAQILVMESGVPDNMFLVIASAGVPLNVETPGKWETATAMFPALTRIVFMEGAKVTLDRPFTDEPEVCVFIMP